MDDVNINRCTSSVVGISSRDKDLPHHGIPSRFLYGEGGGFTVVVFADILVKHVKIVIFIIVVVGEST